MLYKRDYLLGLTDEEKKEFKEVTGRDFSVKRIGGFGTANNFMEFPKAARMCKMLFPNNYLDVAELHDTERLVKANDEFANLINDEQCSERKILNHRRVHSPMLCIVTCFIKAKKVV